MREVNWEVSEYDEYNSYDKLHSLSLGYLMETDIDMKKHDICDM